MQDDRAASTEAGQGIAFSDAIEIGALGAAIAALVYAFAHTLWGFVYDTNLPGDVSGNIDFSLTQRFMIIADSANLGFAALCGLALVGALVFVPSSGRARLTVLLVGIAGVWLVAGGALGMIGVFTEDDFSVAQGIDKVRAVLQLAANMIAGGALLFVVSRAGARKAGEPAYDEA